MAERETAAKKNSETEKEETGKGEKQEKEKESKPIHWLQVNTKYMAICRYALFVITASIVIYIIISHWGETTGFLSNLAGILSPFCIGLLIAYFLIPLVGRIQKLIHKLFTKGKHEKVVKCISIVLAYVLVLGFIAIAFVFVIPQMGQSIQELTDKIPSIYRKLMRELAYFQKKYPEIDFKVANDQLAKMVPNLIDYGTNLMSNVIPMVYSLSVSIVKLAVNLLLGIFMTFS